MNNNIRTAMMTGMLLLLAGTAMAPSAQAATVVDLNTTSCPTPDPEAWVYACMYFTRKSATVYTYSVDYDTTRVCPASGVCFNVPQPFTAHLDSQYLTTVYYNYPTAKVTPNTKQIVEDVCDILYPMCLSIATDAAASGSDMTFVGVVDDNMDQIPDAGVFQLPGGEHVLAPLAV